MAFKKTVAGSSLPKGVETADNVNSTIESTVETSLAALVGSAPETLDTLAELATALGDNPAAITTLQSDVSALETDKADLIDGFVDPEQLNEIGNISSFFLALDGNGIATSSDGTAWAEPSMPSGIDFYAAAFGNGKAVVIGTTSNKAVYSSDGISWNSADLPELNDFDSNWQSIAYGNGKFVAVGNYTSTAAYSEDGIVWTQINLPLSTRWHSVVHGNGKFVALANYPTTAAYSTDGISWSLSSMPTEDPAWASVTFGDEKFVAIGYSHSAYSTDGITWTASSLPNVGDWYRIAHGANKFVVINSGTSPYLYSNNGINWTQSNLPVTDSYGGRNAISYGAGKFIAFGGFSNLKPAISTDGITWTLSEALTGLSSPSGSSYGEVGEFSLIASENYVNSALENKADTDSPTFTGTVNFTGATVTGIDSLPSQSGNSGKYLTTDGTSASWSTAAANDDTIFKAALFFGGN
jgi:hypothetical protein